MDLYRPHSGESRKTVNSIFDAQDNLDRASKLSQRDFSIALALASANEILTLNPMPFPDHESKTDVEDRTTPGGKAARAAVHNAIQYADNKSISNITGYILGDMVNQCHGQQIFKAANEPEYCANMPDIIQRSAATIKVHPNRMANMECQGNGQFYRMAEERQEDLRETANTYAEDHAKRPQDFSKHLNRVLYNHMLQKTAFTPAVYALAARENRLQIDCSITPPSGHDVQSVYLRESPDPTTKPFSQGHQAAAHNAADRGL